VTEDGERTVLGAATGASEDHQFWTSFLRQLVKRGPKGVRLVISDAHEGLRQAIAKVLHGAAWQRCWVHFMRNVLSVVPEVERLRDAGVRFRNDIVAGPGGSSPPVT
jgi:transposase-like protein